MKRSVIIIFVLLLSTSAFAKKVRFAVDMFGIIQGTGGTHIMGNFQTVAGLGTDFVPVAIAQEGATDIYSVIVDIPAFTMYEYKFLSSDQTYDAEFVPIESRVGYNFNDNRWVYIDSVANDTTDLEAVLFAGNAPAGLTLVRFLVNMQNESSVSANGIHIAGSFQSLNSTGTTLYNFDATSIYEVIAHVTPGTYDYKFYNGNASGDTEIVPGSCNVGGSRQILVATDVVLNAVCFSACADCNAVGIQNVSKSSVIKMYPNPTDQNTTLELDQQGTTYTVQIIDQLGKQVKLYEHYNSAPLLIEGTDLAKGLYFVSVFNQENKTTETVKLVIK